MKITVLLVAAFFVVILATPAPAANPNANWHALIREAHNQADIVMRGTVQSVDDQTAVDGGHVYSLQVTDLKKGTAAENVLVRAGGFFYRVPLNKGESVLLFLKSTNGNKTMNDAKTSSQRQVYSLVEAATLKPMIFRVSAKETKPVDKRLQVDFANVSTDQIEDLLSSIEK